MVSVALLAYLFLMQFIVSQYVNFQKTLLFVLLNSLEDMTQERPSSPQKVRVPGHIHCFIISSSVCYYYTR